MGRFVFALLRLLLVSFTGRGYDRSGRMNNLHHKLSYRLHKLLPALGIRGLQKIPVPGLRGQHMYAYAEDGGVAHQLIMYRSYEPFESEVIRSWLRPGMTVYNIGANVGYYVLLSSNCVGDRGKVEAFEPAPENFALLAKSVKENGLGNVNIHPKAVGVAPGMAVLSLSKSNSGDHQLRESTGRDGVVVEVVSIDELIANGASRPEAIILDVQGSELDVLRGMHSVVADALPLILFTEFWPAGLNERSANGAEEFLNILEDSGFSISVLDEKTKSAAIVHAKDLLFSVSGNEERNLVCVRS